MSINIAWLISGYKNVPLIVSIVNSIYREGDSVFIHYDKNSPKEEFSELKSKLSHLPNVFCYQRYPTYWGSFFSVWAEVFMIKQLFQKNIPFDYMINLAGTTVPIKPQESLREFLYQSSEKSFLGSYKQEVAFKTSENVDDETKHLDGIMHRTHLHCGNFIGFPRNKRYYKRLSILFLRVIYKAIRIFKTVIPKNKIHLLCFPKMYYGGVQAMISHKHLETFYKSPKFFWFTLEIVGLNFVDEIFYHTALRNLISEDEICTNNNGLWAKWPVGASSPSDITTEMIPELMQSSHFFARKCESEEIFNLIKKYPL